MTIYSELEAAFTQAKALAQALNALNRTHETWRNCTDEAAWYAPDDFESENDFEQEERRRNVHP